MLRFIGGLTSNKMGRSIQGSFRATTTPKSSVIVDETGEGVVGIRRFGVLKATLNKYGKK